MNLRKQRGFSLMEMMVVLLIVAIVAAASAPMVTRKLMRNASTGDSPWVYTGLSDNIAFNPSGSDRASAIIGASSIPNDVSTRLFIDSGDNASHIAFGNGNNDPLMLTADPTNERVGISNAAIPNNTVALGTGQEIDAAAEAAVVIGSGAQVDNSGSIAINGLAWGEDSTSIGGTANANSIAIRGIAHDNNSVSIGSNSYARGENSIAILGHTGQVVAPAINTAANDAIAIGNNAAATGENSIALGKGAAATGTNSVALGNGATANKNNSVVIGTNIVPNAENQICLGGDEVKIRKDLSVLGYANINESLTVKKDTEIDGHLDVKKTTHVEDLNAENIYLNEYLQVSGNVRICGDLVVDGSVVLGADKGSKVLLRESEENQDLVCFSHAPNSGNNRRNFLSTNGDGSVNVGTGLRNYSYKVSDKRLKNIGEEYRAGLEELKKLTFFHYTFKNDENKTPRVGVMAQDLQKVFPNAVVKGEDGYLRIRLEDMFYAVINAVKELDFRYAKLEKTIEAQQKTIEEQAKLIEAQDKSIKEIENELKEIKSLLKKTKALD